MSLSEAQLANAHGALIVNFQITVLSIVQSEFLWGVVLGIILTSIGSWATIRQQRRYQEKLYARLITDLIANISESVRLNQESRSKSKFIVDEYLELTQIEVNIYGRIREHTTVIPDDNLRREVRDFFQRVARESAFAKGCLRSYFNAKNEIGKIDDRDPDRTKWKDYGNKNIIDANLHCDALEKLVTERSEALIKKLRKI